MRSHKAAPLPPALTPHFDRVMDVAACYLRGEKVEGRQYDGISPIAMSVDTRLEAVFRRGMPLTAQKPDDPNWKKSGLFLSYHMAGSPSYGLWFVATGCLEEIECKEGLDLEVGPLGMVNLMRRIFQTAETQFRDETGKPHFVYMEDNSRKEPGRAVCRLYSRPYIETLRPGN